MRGILSWLKRNILPMAFRSSEMSRNPSPLTSYLVEDMSASVIKALAWLGRAQPAAS